MVEVFTRPYADPEAAIGAAYVSVTTSILLNI
jgi:hypothetical protein